MIQPDMLHIGDAHKTNVDVDSIFLGFDGTHYFKNLHIRLDKKNR